MKFSDGQWLNREGVSIYSPFELRDIQSDKDSITLYASSKPISHRGDTLGGPVLTIRYSSPIRDIIRVQAFHFKGGARKPPEFNLNDMKPDVDILDGEGEASLTSGQLSVHVRKGTGWKAEFSYSGRVLTKSEGRSIGYVTTPDRNAYFREQLNLGVGECVYGLGEHFTHFVKNGQTVDIWNRDGGTSSEQAYKNIPFYLTNRGYGVFVNHPECVSFEVGSEKVSKVQFSIPGEYLEYYIIGGASLKNVLENYTQLTGKPALPPAWSFGLWLTTSFTTNYDENTVNSFVDGMAERDVPLHVFHFDCFWMKEYQWCDFEWDREVFPDPAGMLKRLKEKGLKICVWINPYIAQKSKLFDEGMEKGFLLKRADGSVWQWDMWQPGMGIVDFTNPGACSWYQDKLKQLLDMGVDCFKTDFGERIPVDVVYYDGSDPFKMHNYYAYLYNEVVFRLLEQERGRNEAVVFARSAAAGSQKFPVHWGGDCSATYESMAESLRGGLSLCLSGFGFWSHDIGGFEDTASADVYKRWAAFGLLSSHSRLHGSSSYRVPWLFDEEAVDVLRFFTQFKCSLMPYLFSTACEAADKGIPVMRAMVLEFPEDPACDYLDRQYMLGESLLVAPIFRTDGNVSYYLPHGTWTNFFTGERVEGGSWKSEHHGYMSIPLMVRPNSVIAMGKRDDRPDYDYADGVMLHVFELQEGRVIPVKVYSIQGEAVLEACLERTGKRITVRVRTAGKPFSLIFRNLPEVLRVEGGHREVHTLGMKVIPDPGVSRVEIYLE